MAPSWPCEGLCRAKPVAHRPDPAASSRPCSSPSSSGPSLPAKRSQAFVDFVWRRLSRRSGLGAAAQERGPRPPRPGEEPLVRPCPGRSCGSPSAAATIVGRISAQVDELVLEHMGAGTGQWGMFEALDGEAAAALIATAEDWLRAQGMTRALGPIQPVDLGRAGAADRGLRPSRRR